MGHDLMDLLHGSILPIPQGLRRPRRDFAMAQFHPAIRRLDRAFRLHILMSHQRLHRVLPRELVSGKFLDGLCRHPDLCGDVSRTPTLRVEEVGRQMVLGSKGDRHVHWAAGGRGRGAASGAQEGIGEALGYC